MERIRTSQTEGGRPDREGSPTLSSARSTAEALQAALARVALLERRELALRAALAAAGIDPEAILARLDLVERQEAVPAPEPDPEPFPSVHSHPVAPSPAPASQGRSEASRELVARLAEEVVAGPTTLRLRAAARLVELAGAEAAPALLAAAREAEGAVRASLLEEVGRCGAADAVGSLAEFAADPAAEVRAAAIEAMARLLEGSEREKVLRRGLEDGDPRVRRRTVLCAASARSLDPGQLLLPLLSDPDRQVRRVVCTALGGSRDPMAALALLGALLDEEATVRSAAGAAAERLFGEQAKGIALLPASQRAREVARLRSWVAANLMKLAPGGKLEPVEERSSASEPMERMLDELMETGHPGAGFEDDIPGWTEENDPELQASFARMAVGLWEEDPWAGEAEELLDEAEELRSAAGLDDAEHPTSAAGADAGFEPADAGEREWHDEPLPASGASDEGDPLVEVGAFAEEAFADEPADAPAADPAETAALSDGEDAVAAAADAGLEADEAGAEQPTEAAEPDAAADGLDAVAFGAVAADVPTIAVGGAARDEAVADAESADAAADGIDEADDRLAVEAGASATEAGVAEVAGVDSAPEVEAAAADGAGSDFEAAMADAARSDAEAVTEADEPETVAAGETVEAARAAEELAAEEPSQEPVAADAAPAGGEDAAAGEDEGAAPAASDEGALAEEGAAGSGPDFAAIEAVLLAAIRGCTDADLAEELGIDEETLAPAVAGFLAAGRLVRRGRKLFLP